MAKYTDRDLGMESPISRRDILYGFGGVAASSFVPAVGLGYVTHRAGESDESVVNGPYEIEVAGKRIRAQTSIRPMYDPNNERIRC